MTKRLQLMRNGSKTEGTNVYNKTFCNHKKPAYLCSTETSTVCTKMEAHQNKKTMTESEKERWQLIGVIATAVGTAIAGYFAGKK